MSNTHTTENSRYLNQLAHKHEKIRQLEGHLKQSQDDSSRWLEETNRLGGDVFKLKCLTSIMSDKLFTLMEDMFCEQSAEKTKRDIEALYELSDVILKMAKASY